MKNPYINLLMQSWRFTGDSKKQFLTAIICFIFANIVILIQPYMFGKILNVLQVGGPNIWHDFVFYLFCFSIIPFFFWVFHGNGRVLERTVAFYITKNFKESTFSMITSLPFSWHTDNHSGETINKINKAGNALERFSDENFIYIQNIVKFFGSFVAISLFSGMFSTMMVICGSVVIVKMILIFDKRLIKQYAEILDQEHKVASTLHDYLTNIRTIIALHFENLAKNGLVSKIMIILPIKKQNIVFNEFKWFSTNMLIDIMIFGALLFYGHSMLSETGVILGGSLVVLYQYLNQLSDSFYGFAYNYENIVRMNSELCSINSIYDAYAQVKVKIDAPDFRNWNTVHIQKWNFSYQDTVGKLALKNINIDLKKGARIAFIGESGSGKSTMAAVLKGLYTVQSGKLFIDSVEQKDLSCLSKITTLIPQDPEIFENTIMYNITFGIDAPESEILEAVKLARFDRVLGRLPLGLETNIKEKGVNLSGGEKQRLALARGLFMSKYREIIIMDEPTSSVDPINETAIHKNIFGAFSEKCIISVVHKLHLLPLFDIIYFFDNGEIIESGSFIDMTSRGGKFTNLWKKYTENATHKDY